MILRVRRNLARKAVVKVKHNFLLPFLISLLADGFVSAQPFSITDAPVLAKLSELLRVHREHLHEAIRTARGIETTFKTLRDIEDYERSLRRDISFLSALDLSKIDDLERLILFGDQTDFYFRSLTGKINSDMYNMSQMTRYGDGFLGAMDGLGLIDEKVIRALFTDEKSLEELGIPPEQVDAIVKELGVESTMLELYQIKNTENLMRALMDQAQQLERIAKDPSIELDPGQRVMLLNKSRENLVMALKQQQKLAEQLKERNTNVRRRLLQKAEIEAEIAELEKFYKWHSSLEHNLGFFDTDFIKRGEF